MEDKGKMDELIEQVKLMTVLLSKQDKRKENKTIDASIRKWTPVVISIFFIVC